MRIYSATINFKRNINRYISPHFFPRPGRCVRADPAAVFAALPAFGSRNTLAAADAAFLLVTSLLPFFAIKHLKNMKLNEINMNRYHSLTIIMFDYQTVK